MAFMAFPYEWHRRLFKSSTPINWIKGVKQDIHVIAKVFDQKGYTTVDRHSPRTDDLTSTPKLKSWAFEIILLISMAN